MSTTSSTTTTTTKPIFVLAPGAWHTPDCYDIVREQLHARGWATETVAYPSVGAEPPNKGLADDAAALRATLTRLADEGREIVLAVHSYGGLVGQNAVEGLGYRQRQSAGKKGGVVMFVYLTAFVAPKGATIQGLMGGQVLPWMRVEGDYCHADTPVAIFYHDVSAEHQKKALARLQHQSARIFSDEVTYEPWLDIPCLYFFCETDQAITLPVQQQMAQLLGPDTLTFTSVASHSPFLSRPQDVVNGLELAAKAGQERK